LVDWPGSRRPRFVDCGAHPRQGGAEIFRPFAVETVLMRTEDLDAGQNLVFHLAVDDRPQGWQGWGAARRQARLERFDHDLLDRDLLDPDRLDRDWFERRRLDPRGSTKRGLERGLNMSRLNRSDSGPDLRRRL